MAKDFRTVSKGNYSLPHEGNPTLDELQASCLIRIADATETMAKNYLQMQKDLEFNRNLAVKRYEFIQILERRNSALKGVITRMKNQKSKNSAKENL